MLNSANDMKNQVYMNFLKFEYFPDIFSLTPKRLNELVPVLMGKYKISKPQAIKIIDLWSDQWSDEAAYIDNYEEFNKYARDYDLTLKQNKVTVNTDLLDKLYKFVMQAYNSKELETDPDKKAKLALTMLKREYLIGYICEVYKAELSEGLDQLVQQSILNMGEQAVEK